MNGFRDFDDFRVSAWTNDGLIIRLADAAHQIANSIKKSVGTVSVAATIGIVTIFTPSVVSASPTVVISANHLDAIVAGAGAGADSDVVDSVRVDVMRMAEEVDKKISQLSDFSDAGIAQSTLALANQAIAAMEARKGLVRTRV